MRSCLIFAIALALSSAPALANKRSSGQSDGKVPPKYDLQPAKGARAIDPGKPGVGSGSPTPKGGTRR